MVVMQVVMEAETPGCLLDNRAFSLWALQGLNLRLIPCEAVQDARNAAKWLEAPTRKRAHRCSAEW